MQKWKKWIFLSDVVSLYLALVLAVICRGLVHVKVVQTEAEWIAAHTVIFIPSLFLSLIFLYIAGLYDAKIIYDRAKTLALLLYTQIGTAIFSVLSFYFFKTNLTPKLTIFFYVFLSILFLSVTRSFIFFALQKAKKPVALFWGNEKNLMEKVEVLHAPFTLEFLTNIFSKIDDENNLEDKIIDGKHFNIIYDEKILNAQNALILERAKHFGKSVFSYNQYYEFVHKKSDLENLFTDDLIRNVAESKETLGHYIFRRSADVFIGLLVFPFFILSLPFVYLGQILESKTFSNILFSVQDRVSYLGKRVWLYKFRTMLRSDKGHILKDDENKNVKNEFGNVVTSFGKFLRKTRVDELPQCLNLIKGDLSLIGPRADIIGFHNDMCEYVDNYKLRLLVPQGLTGWAQVHMSFPPRTHEEHKERLRYDIYYLRNRSILLDISIIFKTIKTLISRTGA
jgi:lipopolysaccharide/colanic/teichoic acid biosynthesis glycosyltransferase